MQAKNELSLFLSLQVLTREGTNSYRLVAGNTGKGTNILYIINFNFKMSNVFKGIVIKSPSFFPGVYPIKLEPTILIDISSIESLKLCTSDENLILGAGMSITEIMTTFQQWSTQNENFKYLEALYKHLDLVAHVPVRNVSNP